VKGLYAAGECATGLHGANRLGGNSLTDLLVFGKRAGEYAAKRALAAQGAPEITAAQLDAAIQEALAPLERETGENPYAVFEELQEAMDKYSNMIREAGELEEALRRIEGLKARAESLRVVGNLQFNPGWHTAIDIPNLLISAEAVTRAALMREESRGGHTRSDFPKSDPDGKGWATKNIVIRRGADGRMELREEPLPEWPAEVRRLIESNVEAIAGNPKEVALQ
jgi:succinate dehydrogenase / fumarate reductase, flavoprotein subunit